MINPCTLEEYFQTSNIYDLIELLIIMHAKDHNLYTCIGPTDNNKLAQFAFYKFGKDIIADIINLGKRQLLNDTEIEIKHTFKTNKIGNHIFYSSLKECKEDLIKKDRELNRTVPRWENLLAELFQSQLDDICRLVNINERHSEKDILINGKYYPKEYEGVYTTSHIKILPKNIFIDGNVLFENDFQKVQKPAIQPYLDPAHEAYSTELAAAVQVWMYINVDKKGSQKKTIVQNAKVFLNEHYSNLIEKTPRDRIASWINSDNNKKRRKKI